MGSEAQGRPSGARVTLPQQKTPPMGSAGLGPLGALCRKAQHMVLALHSRDKVPQFDLKAERVAAPPPPLSFAEGNMVVTPELAERIVTEANYERQRPVRQFHVDDLAQHMRRGTFTAKTQIFFGFTPDGRLHLVNGQHRLRAVMSSGVPIEFQVAIVPVATDEELAALYYRHDRLARQRSVPEVLTAVDVCGRFGINATTARMVFLAVPLLASGFQRPNYQTDPLIRDDGARLAFAEQWWPLAANYQELVADAPGAAKKKLLNPQVTAVGLVTLRHQRSRAEDFWRGIAENDGLKKGDPRRTFLLDEHNLSGSQPVAASVAAGAWNAFYEKRSIGFIRIYDGAPVRILGTPYGTKAR